jgi:hypothetical protein
MTSGRMLKTRFLSRNDHPQYVNVLAARHAVHRE